jgi:hypothetical protein
MADRNPFWQTGSGAQYYTWDSTANKIKPESIAAGNAMYHQKDGQNVLYADQHAKFEKQANCGVESDNIYTVWGPTKTAGSIDTTTEEGLRECGEYVTTGTGVNATGFQMANIQGDTTYYPISENDNYLVSDVDAD